MGLNLERIDYLVLAAIVLVSLLTGFLNLSDPSLVVERYIEVAGPLVLLAGSYFLYRTSRSWQKDIARYPEIIITGILFFTSAWVYSLLSREFQFENLFGVNHEFFLAFFHTFAVGSVAIITYGLFLLWKEGEFEFEFE